MYTLCADQVYIDYERRKRIIFQDVKAFVLPPPYSHNLANSTPRQAKQIHYHHAQDYHRTILRHPSRRRT